jgi:hypothetical protein
MRAQSIARTRWHGVARVRSQKAWRLTLLLGGLMAISIAINVAIVVASGSGG